jgi:hypothetical protein
LSRKDNRQIRGNEMNIIFEVFLIQDSGIPLFHWSREDEENESDEYILQSSLFKALSTFIKK